MPLPNVVIGGAPKCGTSSVFYWLADHPDVQTSSVKETFYLVDEGPLVRNGRSIHQQGVAGYQDFFRHGDGRGKAVVEATAYYLYQRTAREFLSSQSDPPHMVFMLRKPTDRIYSSFQYTRHNSSGVDSKITLSEVVDAITGGNLDPLRERTTSQTYCYVLENLIEHSRYVDAIRPWVEALGRERVQIHLFEDLRSDPKRVMQALAAQIGINAEFFNDYAFAARNPTVAVKSQLIYRTCRRLAAWFPRGSVRTALKHAYYHWQRDDEGLRRGREDRSVLRTLDEYFESHNERLASELGVDITPWE